MNIKRFSVIEVFMVNGEKMFKVRNNYTGSEKIIDDELKKEYYENGWI